jgi:hypothetical protein
MLASCWKGCKVDIYCDWGDYMQVHLYNIIKLMLKAPTGDNCQPFSFSILNDSIVIKHSDKIAKHKFNQGNCASYLSLGFHIEVMKNYCLTKGLSFEYDLSDISKPNFEVKFKFEGGGVENAESASLLDALDNRCTDRRMYKKIILPGKITDGIKSKNIKLKSKMSAGFFKNLTETESYIFDDRESFKDIEKYVRYSKAQRKKTRTGFSFQNLLMDPLTALLFKILSSNNVFNILIKKYFKFLTKLRTHLFYKASTGFACFSLPKEEINPENIVRLGMDIFNFWLKLTKENFVAQPISSASLLSFQQRFFNGEFLDQYKLKLTEVSSDLQKEFDIGTDVPVWIMRYGQRKEFLPKSIRTLRKEFESVMESKQSSKVEKSVA